MPALAGGWLLRKRYEPDSPLPLLSLMAPTYVSFAASAGGSRLGAKQQLRRHRVNPVTCRLTGWLAGWCVNAISLGFLETFSRPLPVVFLQMPALTCFARPKLASRRASLPAKFLVGCWGFCLAGQMFQWTRRCCLVLLWQVCALSMR